MLDSILKLIDWILRFLEIRSDITNKENARVIGVALNQSNKTADEQTTYIHTQNELKKANIVLSDLNRKLDKYEDLYEKLNAIVTRNNTNINVQTINDVLNLIKPYNDYLDPELMTRISEFRNKYFYKKINDGEYLLSGACYLGEIHKDMR